MAQPPKGALHRLLERAHSPDAASHIFTEKIQYREQFVRPTTPDRDVIVTPSAGGDDAGASSTTTTTTAAGAASLAAAAAAAAAAETAALGAMGHNGRDARRRARRLKQEQRAHHAKKIKPKPLSARERKSLKLYDVPVGGRNSSGNSGDSSQTQQAQTKLSPGQTYDTFLPLHQLWLGYIREILSPQELRMGGSGAAAKLVAADFHGAKVEVTRSACVSRVGARGIIVRDTRFVFEIVTPQNKVKMIPKEGTFFRVEVPAEGAVDADKETAPQPTDAKPKMVFEIVGSQFMHRAIDRSNRKFKQHFNKEL
ncbi:ribonuclease p protein subunit p29 [Ophiostoma piceae UAMH 11346]|uniref:Ribonuclease p protein subunit p29 n=1 Tax=Ophiostoma piceae (strain UAMH 11346) TaxID=1262450 RepID=S3CCT9_OPHP1|nr:ribonuclease p protein subunit p29 [Ophiostoma piceae UAMH 11346]